VASAAAGTRAVCADSADVQAGADGTGAAARDVLAAARNVSRGSDGLERAVRDFLVQVKAAEAPPPPYPGNSATIRENSGVRR
jgi:methyl-accepting chemotaxis protein